MKKYRVLELMSQLSTSELRWLLQFADSAYFCPRAEVRMLLYALAEHHPTYFAGDHQKSKIRELLPPARRSEKSLYDLLAGAYQVVRMFLAVHQLQREEDTIEQAYLQTLHDRGLTRLFPIAARKHRKKLEHQAQRGAGFYYHSYRLERLEGEFLVAQEGRQTDSQLQPAANALDAWYIATKLRLACEMVNSTQVVNTDFEFRMIEEVQQHVEAHFSIYADLPAVAVYYQLYRMLTQPAVETHYTDLMTLLNEKASAFADTEAQVLYNFARNYCIRKINSGRSDYLQKYFELYQTLLDTGLLYEQGKLTQWDYKNAITVALRLGKFDWARTFIENQKEKLDIRFRENAYNYNLSNLYYQRGEFADALKLLQSVSFTDVYYNLSARSLLLKIYYEQQDTEALFALIEAFKLSLKRNKLVSRYQHDVHLNLLRFVKRAHRLRLNAAVLGKKRYLQKVDDLETKVSQTGTITNIGWLTDRIAELKDVS